MKIAAAVPPHLVPLVTRALRTEPSRRPPILALGEALLEGSKVTLHYQMGSRGGGAVQATPTIRPELLLPYLGRWYVIGEVDNAYSNRSILPIDTLDSVSVAAGGGGKK